MADREPRVPATLDEEILAAEESGVLSTLDDEKRIERIVDELRAGSGARARGRRGVVLRLGAHAAPTTPSTSWRAGPRGSPARPA